MRIIREDLIAANSGWGWEMEKGQVLRLTAMTIIDFVCFNANDIRERFDQARTKGYNRKIYVSNGDVLCSKLNNPMMTILVDPFAGTGHHDLQYGTCSGPRFARAKQEGRLNQYHHGEDIPVPDHGCWENLQRGLRHWSIRPEEIPSPLNIFQHVEIDTASGAMEHSPIRPAQPQRFELRAEMDLIVAASACPDLAAPKFGQPIQAAIVEP